jgi:hypothetical protein
MKVISLFSFLIFIQTTYACELKGTKDFISLSGPVTYALKELGLLKDHKLKGISVFNPVDHKSFAGKVYGGGLFLGQKSLSDFENKIVFYDSSRELKKYLKQSQSLHAIEIQSRGLGSLVVSNEVLDILGQYLKQCSQQLGDLRLKIKRIERELKSFKNSQRALKGTGHSSYLFYLGAVSKSKRPNLLIVNDGPVKTLIDYNVLKSYPSKLEYVSWSQKLIKSLKAPIHIGLSEGDSIEPIMKKISDNLYNISYRGALTPGLSQLLLVEYLIKNSSKLTL